MANYQAVTGQAQQVAATPYQAFGGQLVSPINQQQTTGINAVNDASGLQNGYNAGATGLAAASSATINPTAYSGTQLQQYENPYQNDVINATEAEIAQQNAQQSAALTGSAVGAGAFGGDRAGVAQAALAGQQDIANNATIAGLNTANFTNAQSEFNTQQQTGLSAAQNTAARELAASQQLGTLGNTAQTEALTEANAQTNAGTLQQTTQQAQDTAAYNQFLQQQAYPFQTTGWLANIVEGIGSQSGGTSTGQQTTTGSTAGGIAGGLLGLASFLNRGGRVNEIRVPRKAFGGGLAAPYTEGLGIDPSTGQPLGLGAGSYVTPANLQVGHTMPNGSGMGGNAQSQNPYQNTGQIAKGVQGLGNAFENSSLGDSFNDAIQDMGDGFARGGLVSRKHYDDGGGVAYDDLYNPHGYAPALQPNDVAAANPLVTAATIPTPEAAMAARYANGNMPAPQQDGLTPQQRLAVAMGSPLPSSGDTPPPSTSPTPEGLAAAADANDPARAAGVAKLRTAMGGSNTPPDPNAAYGGLGDVSGLGALASNAPTPPPRPVGLGAAPSPTVDAAAPGGLGAVAAPPTALSGAGLASADTNASPMSDALGGINPNARGMKNNNPGNLESNSWTSSLPGYVGSDGRFAIFSTPQAGVAALDRNLQGYGQKGINTPLSIASTWAPGSEQGNNPTSYGSVIAKTLGVGLNDPVDMSDPNNRAKIAKAIAFVENGPGGGALASAPASRAIAASSPQPGLAAATGAAQPNGAPAYTGAPLTADSPVASTDASPLSNGNGPLAGLFGGHGLNLDPNTRQAMLAAGLGMMAGTSRSGLVNIGQGGLQGLQSYNTTRQLQSEIDLRRAQAERQMVETGLLPAKTASEIGLQGAQRGLLGAQTQGAQTEAEIKKTQLDYMHGVLGGLAKDSANKANAVAAATAPASAAATATPLPGQPGKTSVPPAPAAPPAPPQKTVDPEDDPYAMMAQAQRIAAVPGMAESARLKQEQAQKILHGDIPVRYSDGSVGPFVGAGEAQAQVAGNVASAQERAKIPANIATHAGEQNFDTQNKYKTAAADEAQNGQNTLSQALALRNLMFDPKTGKPTVNSGPYGEHIAGIAATLKQFGIGDHVIAALTGTDPNNAQSIEKLRTSLGSETARADLAGSQVRVAEFQRFLASTPNATLLPEAYKYIIDKAIVPKAQQQIQEYEAVKNLNPQTDDVRGALFDYRQNHPWYAGAPPALPEDRVKGAIYANPAGARARWTGTGWSPVQ